MAQPSPPKPPARLTLYITGGAEILEVRHAGFEALVLGEWIIFGGAFPSRVPEGGGVVFLVRDGQGGGDSRQLFDDGVFVAVVSRGMHHTPQSICRSIIPRARVVNTYQ